MALQCRAAEADACGACPECRNVAAGHHPDVRVTAPQAKTRGAAEKIYIEQIRTLQQEIALRPMAGRMKIFVVDDADRLVEQAANAFLKTLEEPPDSSLLILVTAFPDRLLTTIRSRCRAVRFQPLSPESVAAIVAREKGVGAEEAARLARFAHGSVARVLAVDYEAMAEQRLRFLDGRQRCAQGDPAALFGCSDSFTRNSREAMEFLEFLVTWERDLMAMKLQGSGAALVHGDCAAALSQEVESRGVSDLLGRLELLEQSLRRLQGNVNARLVVETALMPLIGDIN
jgi:DNA polymerase-3 subunit delta'